MSTLKRLLTEVLEKHAAPVFPEQKKTETGKKRDVPEHVIEIANAIRRDNPEINDEAAYRTAWDTHHKNKGGAPKSPLNHESGLKDPTGIRSKLSSANPVELLQHIDPNLLASLISGVIVSGIGGATEGAINAPIGPISTPSGLLSGGLKGMARGIPTGLGAYTGSKIRPGIVGHVAGGTAGHMLGRSIIGSAQAVAVANRIKLAAEEYVDRGGDEPTPDPRARDDEEEVRLLHRDPAAPSFMTPDFLKRLGFGTDKEQPVPDSMQSYDEDKDCTDIDSGRLNQNKQANLEHLLSPDGLKRLGMELVEEGPKFFKKKQELPRVHAGSTEPLEPQYDVQHKLSRMFSRAFLAPRRTKTAMEKVAWTGCPVEVHGTPEDEMNNAASEHGQHIGGQREGRVPLSRMIDVLARVVDNPDAARDLFKPKE